MKPWEYDEVRAVSFTFPNYVFIIDFPGKEMLLISHHKTSVDPTGIKTFNLRSKIKEKSAGC